MAQWQKTNNLLTEVEILRHIPKRSGKTGFIMLRQKSFLRKQPDNAILVHTSAIQKLIDSLKLCVSEATIITDPECLEDNY